MKVEVFLNRALSGLSKKTEYSSPGVMPSFAGSDWPYSAKNDCSGFVDWCLRFTENRKVDHPLYKKINGGWFETSAIYADGLADVGYFTQLNAVIPGAMLVYPDYKGEDGKKHDGHIGIVIKTSGNGIADVTHIIHCSLSGWKKKKDAIQITDSAPWRAHDESIAVWFDSMES